MNVRNSNNPRRRLTVTVMGPYTRDALAAIIAAITIAVAVVAILTRPQNATATATGAEGVDPARAGAATTVRRVVVRAEPSPSAPEAGLLRGGILVPVLEARGGFVRVLTPCERSGWVDVDDVRLHPRASGRPSEVEEATVLIDPGHGGVQPGTVGRGGTPETAANLDIAKRLVRSIDAPRVFLTRNDEYTAGLTFRTTLADRLRAHVFVSVHNNAEADGPSAKPGTETYYQLRSPNSKRLAGLIYEELIRALQGHDVPWTADRDAGAKYRANARGGDYYHLLRETKATTVLVEALFLANPAEEELLRRPEVRDQIADAIATGLQRYVETRDPGSGFTTPYPRDPGPTGRLPSVCVDPS